MQLTALKLCKEIQNVKIGYTQSDEITLILTDFDERNTSQWFEGNIQKIVSVSSSIATTEFNKQWMIYKAKGLESSIEYHRDDFIDFISNLKLANFDSRAYTVSDVWEAYNAMYWRQVDASKNSIQMVARSLYSHKQLQNKNSSQLQDMIMSKGKNWNDFPVDCKRGAFIIKNENGWIIDKNGPVLSQNKKYFFSKVPQIEGYVIN